MEAVPRTVLRTTQVVTAEQTQVVLVRTSGTCRLDVTTRFGRSFL